jgi:hypothetical protein
MIHRRGAEDAERDCENKNSVYFALLWSKVIAARANLRCDVFEYKGATSRSPLHHFLAYFAFIAANSKAESSCCVTFVLFVVNFSAPCFSEPILLQTGS